MLEKLATSFAIRGNILTIKLQLLSMENDDKLGDQNDDVFD